MKSQVDWKAQAEKLAKAMLEVEIFLLDFQEKHPGFSYMAMAASYPPRMIVTAYFSGHPSSTKSYADGFEFSVEETPSMTRELEEFGARLGEVFVKCNLAGKTWHHGGKVQYTFWAVIE